MTDNKGISVAGVIAIMLILSLLGIVGVSLLGSTSSLGLDYMQSQQVFYIAEAGREWYIEQIQADNNWSDNASSGDKGPKNFANGSFTITVSDCQTDSLDMVSTAVLTGYENQALQRVVSCHVERGIPDAFNYALYVGGNITSQGADNFTVTGEQAEGVTNFPSVNFFYYQSIADHVISGNHTFASGTYSGVWYVDGNVTVNSNVAINGSIISTGNIDMNHNENITITAVSPNPALIAEGNFQFQDSDHITITGLIYVGANLSGNFLMQKAEDINFTGSVLVAGNFNLQNSEDVNITYDESTLDGLPPGLSGGSSSVVASGWKEVL